MCVSYIYIFIYVTITRKGLETTEAMEEYVTEAQKLQEKYQIALPAEKWSEQTRDNNANQQANSKPHNVDRQDTVYI